MKKLKIEPVGDMIFLEIEKAKLGALDSSSVKTGMEWGVIKSMGKEVKSSEYKVGDKVFVKAWGVDVLHYEGEDYYFTSEARGAICAVIT